MSTATMERRIVTEAHAVAERMTPAEGPGRFLVQIITPGWGSSGYYSQEVLEAAAQERVYPAGTHMYLDHPTETEKMERPVRSVKDLVAVTTEDARWDPSLRALVAEVRVFSNWRTSLAEMLDAIGVSVRGFAEGAVGEAEGRTGYVFSRLTETISVDFVTQAGRGGRVLQVLEAAKPTEEARNVGQWVESRIHRDFTVVADEMFGDGRLTREERIALSGAIGSALASFVGHLEGEAPALYARDIWDEPEGTTPTETETTENTTPEPDGSPEDVLDHPARQSITQESQEDTMPEIEEARLRALEEAEGRVTVLEAERDAATAALALFEARDTLRPVITAVVNESATLVPAARTRIIESVVSGLNHESTEETARAAATEARTAAETEAAQVAEALGVGKVTGFGVQSTTPDTITEEALDARSARVFGRPKEA